MSRVAVALALVWSCGGNAAVPDAAPAKLFACEGFPPGFCDGDCVWTWGCDKLAICKCVDNQLECDEPIPVVAGDACTPDPRIDSMSCTGGCDADGGGTQSCTCDGGVWVCEDACPSACPSEFPSNLPCDADPSISCPYEGGAYECRCHDTWVCPV